MQAARRPRQPLPAGAARRADQPLRHRLGTDLEGAGRGARDAEGVLDAFSQSIAQVDAALAEKIIEFRDSAKDACVFLARVSSGASRVSAVRSRRVRSRPRRPRESAQRANASPPPPALQETPSETGEKVTPPGRWYVCEYRWGYAGRDPTTVGPRVDAARTRDPR